MEHLIWNIETCLLYSTLLMYSTLLYMVLFYSTVNTAVEVVQEPKHSMLNSQNILGRAYSDMFLFSGLVPFYLMQDVLALNKFKEQRVKNMHSASYSINRPERGFAKRTYAQIAIECLEISKRKKVAKGTQNNIVKLHTQKDQKEHFLVLFSLCSHVTICKVIMFG